MLIHRMPSTLSYTCDAEQHVWSAHCRIATLKNCFPIVYRQYKDKILGDCAYNMPPACLSPARAWMLYISADGFLLIECRRRFPKKASKPQVLPHLHHRRVRITVMGLFFLLATTAGLQNGLGSNQRSQQTSEKPSSSGCATGCLLKSTSGALQLQTTFLNGSSETQDNKNVSSARLRFIERVWSTPGTSSAHCKAHPSTLPMAALRFLGSRSMGSSTLNHRPVRPISCLFKLLNLPGIMRHASTTAHTRIGWHQTDPDPCDGVTELASIRYQLLEHVLASLVLHKCQ